MQGVDVVVADTVEAVEALRPVWGAMHVPDIDADIDYFLTVVQGFDPPAKPHVIHIRTGGHDLLVVARIEAMHQPFKLAYFTLGHVRQRALVLSFDGILGARGGADEELAIRELRAALARNEADLLVIPNLDIEGQRFAAALATCSWLFRGHGQRPSHRWVIDLPESLDAFLARRSAATRKKIRREERELLKLYDGDIALRRFDTPDAFETACAHMKAVAHISYQHHLGAGFTGSTLDRALLRLGLERGWARVWMLYCADRPIAFWPGTAYAGTFAVGTPGFDPAFAKFAVGRFAMLRMIEDLCPLGTVHLMDFGQGEAEYKARYGRPLRLERHVHIAAPRPFPLLVLWLQSLFSLTNALASRLAGSIGWVGHLRAIWRKRGSVGVSDPEVAS
jgi:CelD/BcsL family acetyltransferase involved in cellulose biosynthesis